jgi:hypothetical protein
MAWVPGADILADYEMLQGYCFPDPAWKMVSSAEIMG